MELTRAERVDLFVDLCREDSQQGADFIMDQVFHTRVEDRDLNSEVSRKFTALTDFSAAVCRSVGGPSFQGQQPIPRTYADAIRNLSKGDKAHNNRIYDAFMRAGHHIRELTNRPDYVVPADKPAAPAA